MRSWKIVKSQEGLLSDFKLNSNSVYAIVIEARAFAWWQRWPQFLRRFFSDDNLVIKLDNYPLELNWNGNNLRSLEQTGVFLSKLNAGTHHLFSTISQTPDITNSNIYQAKTNELDLTEILPLTIEDGNRRPIYKLALINLQPAKILVKAEAKGSLSHGFFQDDDGDLQMKVDGEVITNELPKAHKNWFWCGRAQKYAGNRARELSYVISPASLISIDFWADRTPTISDLRILLETNSKLQKVQ